MKLIKEFFVIAITISIVFIVNQNFPDYILPLMIALIIIAAGYIFVKIIQKKGDIFTGSYFEFSVVTMVILLAILYTNGLNSMFYFFLYFILFGLPFIFEPFSVFLLLAGFIILFFTQTVTGDVFGNSLRLGSLVLLSPIAFFFGRELKRREKEIANEHHETEKSHKK